MEDTTAEYAADQLAPTAELRIDARLTIAARTDIGRVREHNEDKYEFFRPELESLLAMRGSVFIVCDGMGGHAAGQIAAEIGSRTFIEVYYGHPSTEPEVALREAALAANRWVLDHARTHPGRKGMGATLSVLVVIQDRAYTVQLGDSRIYRLREAGLDRLTAEHTWVAEHIALGSLTPEEGERHQYRHVLTRALGAEDVCQPEVLAHDLLVGDRFLVCSDGLTNHVTDARIAESLTRLGLAEAARSLVDAALTDGGSDNCTVLLVRVDGLEPVGVQEPTVAEEPVGVEPVGV